MPYQLGHVPTCAAGAAVNGGARVDLNHRHPGYEPGALPTELLHHCLHPHDCRAHRGRSHAARREALLAHPCRFDPWPYSRFWRSGRESNPVDPYGPYGLAVRCITILPPLQGDGFWRKHRDSNPGSASRRPAIFETAAIDHSAILPDGREARGRCWWTQSGSNRRPDACKATALPSEL